VIFQDAYDQAQRLLDERVRTIHQVDVVISGCEDSERAWVFWYDARSYLENDAVADALAGNGPVIVPKSGEPAFIGSVFGSIEGRAVE
jgi:hypothetical protein